MNLILINLEDVNEKTFEVTLSERQSKHCIDVLKVTVGDLLFVGVKNRGKGNAIVTTIDYDDLKVNLNSKNEKFVKIRLLSPFHKEVYTENLPSIDILMAISRPKTFEKVVQQSTCMGVGRMIFFCANKTERSYLCSPKLKKEGIEESIRLGLEQAVHTLYPDIHVYASWKMCSKHLRQMFYDPSTTLAIIADPSSSNRLTDIGIQNHSGPVLCAIGPEGGWTEGELSEMLSMGFKSFNLGNRILRVETALSYIYGQLDLLLTDKIIRGANFVPASREPYWRKEKKEPGLMVLPIKGKKWDTKPWLTNSFLKQ